MRSAVSYLLEAVVGVAIFYFLWGLEAPPFAWVIFAIIAIWIVIMNVRKDAGVETEKSYDRWRLLLGFMIVIVLLVASAVRRDIWLFIVGCIVGLIWVGDLRSYKRLSAKKTKKI